MQVSCAVTFHPQRLAKNSHRTFHNQQSWLRWRNGTNAFGATIDQRANQPTQLSVKHSRRQLFRSTRQSDSQIKPNKQDYHFLAIVEVNRDTKAREIIDKKLSVRGAVALSE